jgi:hypothetical protein
MRARPHRALGNSVRPVGGIGGEEMSGDKIIRGLEEALTFSRGDKTKGKIVTLRSRIPIIEKVVDGEVIQCVDVDALSLLQRRRRRYPLPEEAMIDHEINRALYEIQAELERAMVKFPRFNSGHEGYGVILEELDELWDEVKRSKGGSWTREMRKEAVQVAAMAARFIIDLGGSHDRD